MCTEEAEGDWCVCGLLTSDVERHAGDLLPVELLALLLGVVAKLGAQNAIAQGRRRGEAQRSMPANQVQRATDMQNSRRKVGM